MINCVSVSPSSVSSIDYGDDFIQVLHTVSRVWQMDSGDLDLEVLRELEEVFQLPLAACTSLSFLFFLYL